MSQRDTDPGVPKPIACSLSDSEQVARSAAWQQLLQGGQVERVRVAGGIQLRATPAAARTLRELIDLERECCAWISFDVDSDSTITLTAPGDGEEVLAHLFQISE